jgi:ferredoxin-thioredoxin reductase catalytic subunit
MRRRVEADAKTYGYFLIPDKDLLQAFLEGLKTNEDRYGYPSCPCRLATGKLELDRDIICPCDYRDPDIANTAHATAAFTSTKTSQKTKNRYQKCQNGDPKKNKNAPSKPPAHPHTPIHLNQPLPRFHPPHLKLNYKKKNLFKFAPRYGIANNAGNVVFPRRPSVCVSEL